MSKRTSSPGSSSLPSLPPVSASDDSRSWYGGTKREREEGGGGVERIKTFSLCLVTTLPTTELFPPLIFTWSRVSKEEDRRRKKKKQHSCSHVIDGGRSRKLQNNVDKKTKLHLFSCVG
ncbi:hypothetical protein INR49_011504 [Caranx melampygus]|nr:hypothetical protein INR49_011504 [Caranx melampygus]